MANCVSNSADAVTSSASRKRRLKAARQRRWRRRIRRAKRLQNRLHRRSVSLPEIVAEICTYGDLISAVRARREALGFSQEELDDIAGFTSRYMSKIEIGPNGRDPFAERVGRDVAAARQVSRRKRRNPHTNVGRALGEMSLPTLLQALDVKLVMVRRTKT